MENEEIYKKGQQCVDYDFIIYGKFNFFYLGDINLYDEEYSSGKTMTIIKTISSGFIYGHKIKELYKYFIVARSETHMIRINKIKLEKLIEETNIRKDKTKKMFLRKFFPKLRTYSENDLNVIKNYFSREIYNKNSRIITDGEYDEFVYILIRGSVGIVKSVKRIKKLSDKINLEHNNHLRYIVLEHLSKIIY